MRGNPRVRALDWALMAVVLVQLVLLGWKVRPVIQRVLQFQGAPAIERGARIAFGDRFGAFISFVDTNVPASSRVVLPPQQVDSTFGDVGLMQYLLFPREIINCPSGPDLPGCIRSLTGTETCILRIEGFPLPEDVPPSKVLLPFDEVRGLYCPE
jgi:hypothetical protein